MTSRTSATCRRALLAAAAGLALSGAAQAALIDRGGGMVYDTVLNITWLQNWNQAVGSSYDTAVPGTGWMTWTTAQAWADDLVWGGFDDWRLPALLDTGAPGCDVSSAGGTDCGYNVQTMSGGVVFSEMAHLWYETLGNKARCTPGDAACNTPQPGWGLTNTGPFINMQSRVYWFGLDFAPAPPRAWTFDAWDGWQDPFALQENLLNAMAVRPGDVAAIPEPGTWAMLTLGLTALLAVRRRRAA